MELSPSHQRSDFIVRPRPRCVWLAGMFPQPARRTEIAATQPPSGGRMLRGEVTYFLSQRWSNQ